MNGNALNLVDSFTSHDVLVLGEAMLDSYLVGHAGRLCREAPVPIVTLTHQSDAPGGAANTAANVAALGGSVSLLSVIGDDPEGWALRRVLEACGTITDDLIVQRSRSTLAKRRVIAGSQMLVRYDQGSTEPIERASEDALLDLLSALFPHCSALIVSDYGYGILTPRVIARLAELQARTPRLIVADAKDLSRYRDVHLTAAKPNYAEAATLLGLEEVQGSRMRAQQIAANAARLLELTGADLLAVTLDADGALILDRDGPPYRIYARPVREARVTGAGDTFISALTLALASGASTPQAAELAATAAAIVVEKDGTATCAAHELRQYHSAEEKVVTDAGHIAVRVALYRQQKRRIVFTNGCFDILHRGHITYLNRAKALGDVLIVGINSDASVRRLKGCNRPINALDDRLQVLAALSSIDHIVPFEEDTPEALIRAVRPDVFVKGGDYTHDTLPEAALVEELGGAVQILPYMEDRSTTGIIERIRGMAEA